MGARYKLLVQLRLPRYFKLHNISAALQHIFKCYNTSFKICIDDIKQLSDIKYYNTVYYTENQVPLTKKRSYKEFCYQQNTDKREIDASR